MTKTSFYFYNQIQFFRWERLYYKNYKSTLKTQRLPTDYVSLKKITDEKF